MLVTLSGIVMLGRAVQLKNACCPMLVTLSGIVMLVRARKSANALSGIWIVPSGILILLTAFWMLYSGSQEISTSEIIRVKSVKLVQFPNIRSPKLVTLSGMVMLVRAVQL